jgi:(1->4)-alpha-D-glucan 1-alpha-D-glucosylmutase
MAPAGALNGLTQCILKCTLPGVPDFYQGTEFWDFSLVDPDNRRPVDYAARSAALAEAAEARILHPQWQDGRVKESLTNTLLALRAAGPEIFADGAYEPLPATGPREDNVVSFLRRHRDRAILVAVPRLCAAPCMAAGLPLPPPEFWEDTRVELPGPERSWRSALDLQVSFEQRPSITCAELFARFPGAVLH